MREQITDVQRVRRERGHTRNIARGAGSGRVGRFKHHERSLSGGRKFLEDIDEHLGLRLRKHHAFNRDELLTHDLVGKYHGKRLALRGLVQFDGKVTVTARSERNSTTDPNWRAARTMTGLTSSF